MPHLHPAGTSPRWHALHRLHACHAPYATFRLRRHRTHAHVMYIPLGPSSGGFGEGAQPRNFGRLGEEASCTLRRRTSGRSACGQGGRSPPRGPRGRRPRTSSPSWPLAAQPAHHQGPASRAPRAAGPRRRAARNDGAGEGGGMVCHGAGATARCEARGRSSRRWRTSRPSGRQPASPVARLPSSFFHAESQSPVYSAAVKGARATRAVSARASGDAFEARSPSWAGFGSGLRPPSPSGSGRSSRVSSGAPQRPRASERAAGPCGSSSADDPSAASKSAAMMAAPRIASGALLLLSEDRPHPCPPSHAPWSRPDGN